jgi:aminoglycoside phosphotransferase family enzyme/predicted kinase
MTARYPSLVAALLHPAVYPHRVDRVELVETHISWVLLAGDRVYKIKKPVDLGFLDFTTLARRRFFCEEEVRLNRRLAPDVYLGVVEIKGSRRRPRLDGAGRTIEVAVAMQRLPEDRMLHRLARAGAADPGLLDTIAVTVARFHAEADTGGEIDVLGGIDTVRKNWEENFDQTAELEPALLPPDLRRRLREYVDGFLDREAQRFAARVRAGRCRDCHGDLQAQHVCCTDPIRIFDCIEFNHRFRFGDTASEIAFLAMDLERLGRADLAIRFLNAYLEESGDYEAVPLLDFYRAYRAYVRGKVLGFQVAERPDLAEEARALFELSAHYAGRLGPPRLLITTGVMGSGKSTVARMVAAGLGAIVIRTDAVRKRLAGVPLRQRGAHGYGEDLYTAEMSARTYAEALRLAAGLLASGWPVIVDGAFPSAVERGEARELARRAGLAFTVLWCEAPDAVLAGRLRRRADDPHEVSDGREELLSRHRDRYEPPADEPGVLRVDTAADTGAPIERVLGRLRSVPR